MEKATLKSSFGSAFWIMLLTDVHLMVCLCSTLHCLHTEPLVAHTNTTGQQSTTVLLIYSTQRPPVGPE